MQITLRPHHHLSIWDHIRSAVNYSLILTFTLISIMIFLVTFMLGHITVSMGSLVLKWYILLHLLIYWHPLTKSMVLAFLLRTVSLTRSVIVVQSVFPRFCSVTNHSHLLSQRLPVATEFFLFLLELSYQFWNFCFSENFDFFILVSC